VDDVVTGTGVGGGPRVQVFQTAQVRPAVVLPPTAVLNFFAYEGAFRGGVLVGGGDVTGDRIDDIVTGTGPGGGPRVLAFDGKTAAQVANFFAFQESFTGGVRVATLDRDGDGDAEILAGTGPGIGNRVLAFSPTGSLELDVRPFDVPFTGGVFVG
jgi:hypothetical protein